MTKSGLIFGGLMLVAAAALGAIFPLAVPCLALLAGVGAGYMAGRYDQPATLNSAIGRGAGAGLFAGLGALVGHMLSALLAALGTSARGMAGLVEMFGFSTDISSPLAYTGAALAISACFGMVELIMMTGLGLLGGWLWYQTAGMGRTAGMPEQPR